MDIDSLNQRQGIGTLKENSLHAELIHYCIRPGDRLEENVEGYIVDIVRGDLLIEVQTRHFSALKNKLIRLVDSHPLRLVYPIARDKWILRRRSDASEISRRKSPRRGRIEHIFLELIRIPDLIAHPNFSIEVLMIAEEEVQTEDGKGSWRRKGRSITDRRLLGVSSQHVFITPLDFRSLIPEALPHPFTSKDLAAALKLPSNLSQKMCYCLRQMRVIQLEGKRGKANLYIEVNDD
ncbi:MAG: hypothetical protein ACM3PY_20780 [Omnitrophica WOR_2 bacterium]